MHCRVILCNPALCIMYSLLCEYQVSVVLMTHDNRVAPICVL